MTWKDLALSKGATVVLELDETGTTPFDNLASTTDPTVSGTPTKGEPGLGYDNAFSLKPNTAVLDTGIVNANISKVTVEFMFKMNSGTAQFMTARGTAPGVVAGFGSDFTGGAQGQVWFGFNGDNLWKQVATNATYRDGNFHHAVLVWDNSIGPTTTWDPGQVKLYIDKVLVTATNYRTYNSNFPVAPVGNNGTWRFGAVNGTVDDWFGNFAIYPGVALVQADVDALYNINFTPPVAPTDAAAPVVDAAYSGGGVIIWPAVTYATSYDYRVNGGAAVDVPSGRRVVLSGLTNGTAYTVEVRAKNVNGPGPWGSVVLTPVATDLYDDFDRADSATVLGGPVQGGPYTARAGVLGISGNAAYLPSGTDGVVTVPASSLDQDVEIVLGTVGNMGAVARWASGSDYWMAWVENGTNPKAAKIYHRSSTAWDVMAESWLRGTDVWLPGDKLRIQCIGRIIRMYRNNVLVAECIDNFMTAGATNMGIRLDNQTARLDRVLGKAVTSDTINGASADYADDIAAAPAEALVLYKGRDSKIADEGAVS